jgi:excisionase family DNA binding protein
MRSESERGMQLMTMRPHLTVQDIATRENISIDTVKRALRNGGLKGHKIGSRGDWRIAVEDYEDWISRNAPIYAPKETE